MKRWLSGMFTIVLLVAFSTSAVCDASHDLGSGVSIDLPNGWTESSGTWINGDSEMLMPFVLDIKSLGKDPATMDMDNLLATMAQSFGAIGTTEVQDEETTNGFQVKSMKTTLQGNPLEVALMWNDSIVCVLAYVRASSLNNRNVMEFVKGIRYTGVSVPNDTGNYVDSEGYYLYKTPIRIRLTENDYNIAYLGMPENSPSVIRSGYSYGQIDAVLSFGEKTDMIIWRIGEDGLANRAANVRIRIKDQKYDGIDMRSLPEDQTKLLWDAIVTSMSRDGSYRTETINGIPYAYFDFMTENQIRYVTIVNGDIIYIYLITTDKPTEEDMDLLRTVLESLSIAEG